MKNLRGYFLIFAIGGILGTLYDWLHVYYGVLSYNNPHIWGTSFWVPVEFGVSGVIGAFFVRQLRKRFTPPSVTLKRAAFDAFLLLAGYLINGFLVGNNALTLVALVPVAILAVGTRPTRFVLIGSVLAAISGPLGEICMIGAGLFHYNVAQLIPFWLPLLWLIAAGAFMDFSILLMPEQAEKAVA